MDPFTQDPNHLPDGAIHHSESTLSGGNPGTTRLAAPQRPDRKARGKTVTRKCGEAQREKSLSLYSQSQRSSTQSPGGLWRASIRGQTSLVSNRADSLARQPIPGSKKRFHYTHTKSFFDAPWEKNRKHIIENRLQDLGDRRINNNIRIHQRESLGLDTGASRTQAT